MQEGKFCTPPREANYWQKLQVALHVTLACLQQQRRSISNIIIYWRVFHLNVESSFVLLHYKIDLENLHQCFI